MPKTVQGRQKQWQLLEVIGRGDAGEVLTVQTDLAQQHGVLKRPVQNVSGGTIVRQATQIENEGQILKQLDGMDYKRGSIRMHTPLLLDESIPGTSATGNLFMISEQVPGVSIESLLKSLQRGEGTFSPILVLKVLVGLVNLLPKVHEKGILWNDVKMEHIFWHEPADQLSFIDWGNGLRFDPLNPDEQINPMLDYRQLIEEGNRLIEQTSPNLAAEIGWPRTTASLSAEEIIQLRFRVEFMENYLGMRVTEFKLAFRKALQDVGDLDAFKAVLELSKALIKLGVPAETEKILEATSELTIELIKKSNLTAAKAVAQLALEAYPDDAPQAWRLLNYTLDIPDLTSHEEYPSMAAAMLRQDWQASIWIAQTIHSEAGFPLNLTKLIMAMRNFGLMPNSNSPSIAEMIEWLITRANQLIPAQTDPQLRLRLQTYQNSLTKLNTTWPQLSPRQQLGDQFLKARELLSDPASGYLGFPRQQLSPVNNLLSLTRDIYRNWESGDIDTCQNAIHQLFALEPGALYLHDLASRINQVDDWISRLIKGPEPDQTATELAAQLTAEPFEITRTLGQPAWLTAYRQMAAQILAAKDITTLRETAESMSWPLPWLQFHTTQLNLPLLDANTASLTQDQTEALSQFHLALRAGFPAIDRLETIRRLLPEFHQGYKLVLEAREALWSAIQKPPSRWPINAFPLKDQENIQQLYAVIDAITSWQDRIRAGQHSLFEQKTTLGEWKVLMDIDQSEKVWSDQIRPLLTEIHQKHWLTLELSKFSSEDQNHQKLISLLSEASRYWSKVPDQGIFSESAQEMTYIIETAQTQFFTYWQSLKSHQLKPLRWIVENYQSFFSQINQVLLRIGRHLHEVSRAIDVLNAPEMAHTRLAQNSAGGLMFSLVQIENLLQPPSRKHSVIRDWQKQYFDLLAETSHDRLLRQIETIEAIHPLLPWLAELAQRDTDYFQLCESQKW